MQKIVEEQQKTISGHGFFDFGKAAYGTLEIELTGTYNENIEVVISEEAADGMIRHTPGWTTFMVERLHLKNGRHTYCFNIPEHLPAYGGFPHPATPAECGGEIAPFRYVEVNHYYGEAVVRRTVWCDDWNDEASFFESSDEKLNKVWEFCKYSIKATNVFGVYIDGERERQPYEADSYINQLGHFCCDANYTTARNTIDFFEKFPTWPTEWQLITPVLARDYWLYSGDRSSVDRWLKWLPERLLPEFVGEDGLLRAGRMLKGLHVRDIIDWPQRDRDDYELGACNFVPNAYYHGACLAMYELTSDEKYLTQARRVREVLRKAMWRNGVPVDSLESSHTSLHSLVFALRFGIAEAEERAALAALIAQKGMVCSVYGAQFLLECCAECGLHQLFYDCLTGEGERSWLNMLAQGSTISMEAWSEFDKPFQDWTHAWGAAPANLIPRYLCGIRPLKPGFQLFSADVLPVAPERFTLRAPTPCGQIEMAFEGLQGTLTVPEGTKALHKETLLEAGTHRISR